MYGSKLEKFVLLWFKAPRTEHDVDSDIKTNLDTTAIILKKHKEFITNAHKVLS